MKLVTFKNTKGQQRIGWMRGKTGIVDMKLADKRLPTDMLKFIDQHDKYFAIIKEEKLKSLKAHYKLKEVELLAPLPQPRSIRDHVAFEQHMLNASKTFGHTVAPAWYEIPIFYFTNHHGVYGPHAEVKRPAKETKLDLELEIAAIIGKKGADINPEEADDYIFGYTIFNDWTARAIQRQEMTAPLGPHKGKDFANVFGPCIVTKDEFEKYRCSITRKEHPKHLKMPLTKGDRFDVKMTAIINGETICEGNYKTVHWTFPQMIKRASENGVNLMPGDILGSGTVGWGSLIENNFKVHRPLEPGDVVTLEIEGIGSLTNTVV